MQIVRNPHDSDSIQLQIAVLPVMLDLNVIERAKAPVATVKTRSEKSVGYVGFCSGWLGTVNSPIIVWIA